MPHPDETTEPDPLLALIGAAVLDPNQWSREAARDVVLRALRATVTQSEAEAAHKIEADSEDDSDAAIHRFDAARGRRADAHDETNEAGAALAKALRQTSKRAESPVLTDYTRHALKRLRETTSPGLKVGGRSGDALVEMGYAEHIGLGVYRVTGAGRMARL